MMTGTKQQDKFTTIKYFQKLQRSKDLKVHLQTMLQFWIVWVIGEESESRESAVPHVDRFVE